MPVDDVLALWALDTHSSDDGVVPMPRRGTYRLARVAEALHAEASWTDAAGDAHTVAFDS